jgi:hypothetical protein
MNRTFRARKIKDPLLMPVSVRDFVDEKHLATFVLSVVSELHLAKILSCYSDEKGRPPFRARQPRGGPRCKGARETGAHRSHQRHKSGGCGWNLGVLALCTPQR